MGVWVRFAGATKAIRLVSPKPVLGRIERGMLTRNNQARLQTVRSQRASDRRKFDRFGPGADDESNVRGKQPSP